MMDSFGFSGLVWFMGCSAVLFEGFMYMFLMRRRSYVISRGYDGTLYDRQTRLFFFHFVFRPLVGFSCHSHELDSSHKRKEASFVTATITKDKHLTTERKYFMKPVSSLRKKLCVQYLTI